MIIDSHQHVFWHGRDDAGLVADLDAHNIDVAWLLSWDVPPFEDAPSYHAVLNPLHRRGDGTHPGIPLSDLLIAKRNYPDRFIVGYCPHPLLGDAPGMFKAAVETFGVRVCGEWKFRIPFDDPRCINLYRMAGKLGCPVVLHLDVPWLANPEPGGAPIYQPAWYGGTVANLERALAACPETNFIGHAPGFWREISGDADAGISAYPGGPVTPGGRLYPLFDRYPNLYADISAGSGAGALGRDLVHGRAFAIRYADRLLFGRDYYGDRWNRLITDLDLPPDVHAKITCTNAQGLLAATEG